MKRKTQIFQKKVHRTMLSLMGMSAWRAAGWKGCIPCRNFEKIKLKI
jgi:hypothetical protein